MNKSIPIWRDANALLLEVEQSVRHFTRYHKVTLGAEMRQQAMLVCRLIYRVFFQQASKIGAKTLFIQPGVELCP